MVTSPKGLGPEKDYPGKGPSSRQRGRPKKQDRNCLRVINIWYEPQIGLDTKTY
jgi:hypothetical protein